MLFQDMQQIIDSENGRVCLGHLKFILHLEGNLLNFHQVVVVGMMCFREEEVMQTTTHFLGQVHTGGNKDLER